MRETLFRGKRVDKDVFVEGDLIHGVGNKNGRIYILPIIKNLAYLEECDPLDGYEVIPETVGQFTGLFDKNGRKIFEGDVLGGCNGSINGSKWSVEPFAIKFENGKFTVPTEWGIYRKTDSTHYLEIIGNIHNNQELLNK